MMPGHPPGPSMMPGRPPGPVFGPMGGPVRPGGGQPGERPLRGTVTFTAAGQRPVSVLVGRSGTFSVALLPGTYHVAGRSPAIVEVSGSGAQHETACSNPLTVHVTGQRTLKIAVTCIVP